MVSGGAGWFQKRLSEAVWFHGSVYEFRKGGAGWFQERLGGFSRGCVACQESLGWFQEKLRGFRKGCVVSGGVAWFPARLWGFTKVCVAYDVGSLMVKG